MEIGLEGAGCGVLGMAAGFGAVAHAVNATVSARNTSRLIIPRPLALRCPQNTQISGEGRARLAVADLVRCIWLFYGAS